MKLNFRSNSTTNKSSVQNPFSEYNVMTIQPSEMQVKVRGAITRASKQKIGSTLENRQAYQQEALKEVNKYQKSYEEKKKVFKELQTENNLFIKNFIKQESPDQKKSRFERTFKSLFNDYKTKEYSVSHIKLENNLFKDSPLLCEQEKIANYYKTSDKNQAYKSDKIFNYLYKVNSIIETKIQSSDRYDNQGSVEINNNRLKDLDFFGNKKIRAKELEKEIKSNEDYIKNIRDICKEKEQKHENFKLSKEKEVLNELNDLKEIKEIVFSKNTFKTSEKKITTHNKQSSRNLENLLISPKSNIYLDKENLYSDNISSPKYASTRAASKDFMISSPTSNNTSPKKQSNLKAKVMRLFKHKFQGTSPSKVSFEGIKIDSPMKQTDKIQEILESEGNVIPTDRRKSEREKFLNLVYDQIKLPSDNTNIKDMVSGYAKKFLSFDKKAINDIINKKVEAGNIMKSIQDVKSKIDNFRVNENITSHFVSNSIPEYINLNLRKIKDFDKQIGKLDYEFAKKLMKSSYK